MITSEAALYRIAEEALQNFAKHARARSVQLRLLRRELDVVLEIRDDGKGFKLQELGSQQTIYGRRSSANAPPLSARNCRRDQSRCRHRRAGRHARSFGSLSGLRATVVCAGGHAATPIAKRNTPQRDGLSS